MDRYRAIQIGDDQRLLGSGYLIAPGLILTALHVPLKKTMFKPQDAIPAGVTVGIRKLGDLQPGGGSGRAADRNWYPAELLWPAAGSLKIFDMAILKVVVTGAAPAGYFDCDPVPLLPLAEPSGDEETRITCSGLGFPGWREQEGELERTYLAHIADGTLDIPDWTAHPDNFSYTINSEAPPLAEDWKGISGTALFDLTGQIIAVLSGNEATKSNRQFTATLVPDFRSADKVDPYGFWRALDRLAEAQGGKKPTGRYMGRGGRPNQAIEYLHILDRYYHDEKIKTGFKRRSDTRPAVVLFHSRERDDPPSYSKRYASGDLTWGLFGNRIQSEVPELRWPYHFTSSNDRDEAVRQLKDQLAERTLPATGSLANAQSAPALSSDDPAGRFQQYFATERIPRALQVLLNPSWLEEAHYEMLASFLEFFADAAQSVELVCLFIGIIYEPDAGKENDFINLSPNAKPCSAQAIESWTKIAEHLTPLSSRIHIWDAGALTQINSLDVNSWREILKEKSVRPSAAFFIDLTAKLAGGSRPLVEVSEMVAKLGGGPG